MHGFFGREGGVSKPPYASLNVSAGVGDELEAVLTNRKLALESIGLSSDNFVFAGKLGHGNKVFHARSNTPSVVEGYDAVITNVPGLAVGLAVADCIPLFLYDAEHNAVAVVHAGWKGLQVNIIKATIDAMANAFGSEPFKLVCAVGPSICQNDYQVGLEFADYFSEDFYIKKDDHLYLDLNSIAKQQLVNCGVKNIEFDSRCTYEENSSLFSYRKDKLTGRGLAVIAPTS